MADPNELRTPLPDSDQLPRFAGVATFCRFPLIEAVPAERRPVDWAVYGVPFDGGVTYHPGARFGPRAVRDASQYMMPGHLEHGVDIAQALSLADAGDAPVRPYSCRATVDAAREHALAIGDPEHTRLLAVGGDHSIAYANIAATWQRRGRPEGGLAVMHCDAHPDVLDTMWDEKWGHGSAFLRAIEDGLVDPHRMLTVGVRGPLSSRDELERAAALGIQVITCDQWRAGFGERRIEEFLLKVGKKDEVYLSFDVDCVDPAFAPGTGTPVCGGFTSAEAFGLLRRLAGINLVGADVVEVLPQRDHAGITALLAAHVVFEILSISAARREKG
ncbi:MAG: arginase family protein [Planctomycetota bacterium]|jgi:agmatinase